MIPITERFLSDAGGWQALKHARTLQAMGRVSGAKYEPPLLEGRVREGEQEFRSGLRILSASKVENLCTCRDARQRGLICAHALAVGLEIIKAFVAPVAAQPSAVAAPAGEGIAPLAPGERPAFHLRLEGSLNHLAARLDAERSGHRTTLTGAPARHPAEAAALERLRRAGFTGPDREGQLVLKGESRILAFFASELPRLQQEWSVEI